MEQLAAMQAIYPPNTIINDDAIRGGGSVLFLFGKFLVLLLTMKF
jgi:hypothetical protein